MIQGMKQGMVAAPTVQLFMHALQANTEELADLIAQEIAKNPALEEVAPRPAERDADTEKSYDHEAARRHAFALDSQPCGQTLADFLEEQIRHSALTQKVKEAALAMLPYLNRHGFFAEDAATVQSELQLTDTLYRQALGVIQDLDPAGVGAEDLRGSLILQLKRVGEKRGLPMLLLKHHWEALVHHRYAEAARALEVEEEAVQLAAARIARLNPDPGSGFSRAEINVVTPDLSVDFDGADFQISLAGAADPQVALSAEYRDMMAQHADKAEVRQFLSRCFREGREFIRVLANRKDTLLAVTHAICERQKEFFRKGKAHIRPLKMEDIAEDTGLHVSTVSRAVRGKYLRCAFGVMELRSFFTSGISSGEEETTSAASIQHRIRQLIAEEPPASPLSDADICAALQTQGIRVARRTVAKYREQLKILPASLRKRR